MDILIMTYDRVIMSKRIKDGFEPASVFEEAEVITFNKIPKNKYEYIEQVLEDILEHELLHVALYKNVSGEASTAWDNLFPTVESFKSWRK